MARQIIILESLNPDRQASEPVTYRYAFWLSVPVARQSFYATLQATFKSAVMGITAAETLAIQTGTIKEEIGQFSQPSGTTAAQITTRLQVAYSLRQTGINSAAENAWDRYGTNFDGTSWTAVTAA